MCECGFLPVRHQCGPSKFGCFHKLPCSSSRLVDALQGPVRIGKTRFSRLRPARAHDGSEHGCAGAGAEPILGTDKGSIVEARQESLQPRVGGELSKADFAAFLVLAQSRAGKKQRCSLQFATELRFRAPLSFWLEVSLSHHDLSASIFRCPRRQARPPCGFSV